MTETSWTRRISAGILTSLKGMGDLVAYTYLVIFVLTFVEVALRYGFNSPTSWTIEVCLFLAATHFLLGGASAAAHDGHFRIDVVVRLLKPGAVRFLDRLRHVIVVGVCSGLLYWALPQALRSISKGELSPSGLDLPTPMILKTLIATSLVLIIIQALAQLVALTHGDNE